jgi:hypothetical protein
MTLPLFEASVPTREPSPYDEAHAMKVLIRLLAGCSYTPGTATKRFVRNTYDRLVRDGEAFKITDSGRRFLYAVAWSYRRQLPQSIMPFVEKMSGGKGIKDYHPV